MILGSLTPSIIFAQEDTYPELTTANIGGIGSGPMRAFVDVVKTSNRWAQPNGDPLDWDTMRDERGWPTTDFRMILFDWRLWGGWLNPPYDDPERKQIDVSGVYKVSFKGDATVSSFAGDSYFSITNQTYDVASNTTTLDLYVFSQDEVIANDPNDNSGLAAIQFTNTVNPESSTGAGITDLEVIRPGYHDRPDQVFTDEFINALKPFAALRFMDVQHTNNSNPFQGDPYPNNVTLWQDRVTKDSPSQVLENRGLKQPVVAWEYDIEIANEVGADLWLNIPVHAELDYVKKLAILVAYGVDMGDADVSGPFSEAMLAQGVQTTDPLDPSLNVYLEHSNEVWNFGFSQYIYNKLAAVEAADNGFDWGTSDEEHMARRRHIKRAYEFGQIFSEVLSEKYGTDVLLDKVRPIHAHWASAIGFDLQNQWQAAVDWMESTYGPVSDYFYGFAIAPYMNDGAASDTATPEELLAALVASSDSQAAGGRSTFIDKSVNDWGVAPMVYEGGPDTGGGSTTNVQNRILMNRLPGMKDAVKRDMIDNWFELGGKEFAYFVVAGGASRHGSWGATEDVADLTAPKYQALLEIAGDVSIQLITASIPDGAVNTEYATQLQTFGGVPPIDWTVESGSLPVGLTLNAVTGLISGTPAPGSEGVYSPTIRATDEGGEFDEALFPFEILAFNDTAPVFQTSTTLADGQEGNPYQANLIVTGGNGALNWSVTNPVDLPSGLSFNDGLFSGTPQVAGNYSFEVVVTDSDTNSGAGDEARATFSVVIDENPDIPASPTDLAVNAVSATVIDLSWTDNADNETGYEIQISGDGGQNYLQSIDVGPNVTSYSHTGLTPETIYFYRVRAVNGSFVSGFSGAAGTTTLPPLPELDVIAGFDFATYAGTENTATATTANSGATVTDLTRGAGAAGRTNYGNELGGFNTAATSFTKATLQEAISADNYFEFTVSPLEGYAFDIEEVFYSAFAQANGTNPGDFSIEVEYSLDGFATAGTSLGGNSGVVAQTIGGLLGNPFSLQTAGEAALQGVTAPVTFRIYGYKGAGYTSKGIGFDAGDDLAIRGTVTELNPAVPEVIAGFDFATYSGSEATASASTIAENSAASNLVRGAGTTGSGSTYQGELGGFNTSGPRFDAADIAGSIANDDYFEFSVTPDSGYVFDIEEFFYSAYAQNNGTSPENFSIEVQYSLDGFATNGVSLGGNNGVTAQTIGGMLGNPFTLSTESEAALQGVSETVTFRLYGYKGASYTAKGIGFDAGEDLFVFGTVRSAGGSGGGGLTLAAPSDLAISAPAFDRIAATWQDNADGETAYEVQVSTDGGATYPQVETLDADSSEILITGLSASTEYTIRVRAVAGSDASSFAGPVAIETPAVPGDSAVIAAFDFAGYGGGEASAAATTENLNVTVSDLTRGPGASGSNTYGGETGGFNTTGTRFDDPTLEVAIANGEYYEFSVSPKIGYALKIDQIFYSAYAQNNGTDPEDFSIEIQYSLDGFETAGISLGGNSGVTPQTLGGMLGNPFSVSTTTEAALQSVEGTVTFRIYGYDGVAYTSKGVGFSDGDDIAVFGSLVEANSNQAKAYRYLRFWIDASSSDPNPMQLRELRWLFGDKEMPFNLITGSVGDESVEISTSTGNVYAFDGPWKMFDGDTNSHWYVESGNEVTLDFKDTAAIPTGVRIASPSWSRLTAFHCEASNDGETWTELYEATELTGADYPDSWGSVRSGDFDFGFPIPDTVDQTPPSVPDGLAAVDVQDIEAKLTWEPSVDAGVGVSSYRVFVEGQFWNATTEPELRLLGLSPNTTYDVTISALDVYGNESAPSAAFSVTTLERAQALDPMVLGIGLGSDLNGVWKSGVNFADEWANYDTSNPFNPVFLDELAHYEVIRFMDMNPTNNNWIENWEDRRQPDDLDQRVIQNYTKENVRVLQGVAFEWMIKLCNLLEVDMWINVPHAASNDYVAQLANLIRDNLDPNLQVMVEYSNEAWAGFGSEIYTQEQGYALGLEQGDFPRYGWFQDKEYARFRFYVMRSLELHEIFDASFGEESHRVYKVLSGWSSFPDLSRVHRDALSDPLINPNGREIDGYALAPYFNFTSSGDDEAMLADFYARLEGVKTTARDHYEVWSAEDIPMITYEGGQHITTAGEAASRNPLIYNAYMAYLDALAPFYQEFTHFVHHGGYGRGMAWGSKEYVGQPELLAFKYRALKDWWLLNASLPEAEAPIIVSQPDDANVGEGAGASFEVVAIGKAPFTYTWYRNGEVVSGAEGPALQLSNLSVENDGDEYYVVVSNSLGPVISDIATLSVTALPNKAEIKFAAESIAIDGLMDSAWSDANEYPISRVNRGTVDGAADLDGSYRVLWDGAGLYFYVEVQDDILVYHTEGTTKSAHDFDSVEFYLDPDNAKTTSYQNDGQYVYNIVTGVGASAGNPTLEGVLAAGVEVEGGYNVEFFVPWSNYGVNPSAGDYIGFDLMIADNDIPDTESSEGKIAWWTDVNQSWSDPSYFGTGLLLSEEIEAVPGDLSGDGVIDSQDAVLARGAVGTTVGSPRFIESMDYDNDGTITRSDYSVWYKIARRSM
ncbi:sugar-binding protein [Pelagicoccus sp. SDUM812005]|uniref:sugar-binding protein n=1 Tax=Pelagicoccus sp. SDUM812005 TaxID=3041257 RepID=UPI00280FC8B4|nr:sugar-binding protein [Pelagicoccus sp. SDUM812005]MDQ8181424.1 sugar-binding protein [Pelagicoccus sp. SDUM812005]